MSVLKAIKIDCSFFNIFQNSRRVKLLELFFAILAHIRHDILELYWLLAFIGDFLLSVDIGYLIVHFFRLPLVSSNAKLVNLKKKVII